MAPMCGDDRGTEAAVAPMCGDNRGTPTAVAPMCGDDRGTAATDALMCGDGRGTEAAVAPMCGDNGGTAAAEAPMCGDDRAPAAAATGKSASRSGSGSARRLRAELQPDARLRAVFCLSNGLPQRTPHTYVAHIPCALINFILICK